MSSEKGYRTWTLCFLVFAGAFVLALLTRDSALVYAYGLVASGALGVWVGGKGWSSYTAVLAGKSPQYPAPATTVPGSGTGGAP